MRAYAEKIGEPEDKATYMYTLIALLIQCVEWKYMYIIVILYMFDVPA